MEDLKNGTANLAELPAEKQMDLVHLRQIIVI